MLGLRACARLFGGGPEEETWSRSVAGQRKGALARRGVDLLLLTTISVRGLFDHSARRRRQSGSIQSVFGYRVRS
jgi:hypothetical protein